MKKTTAPGTFIRSADDRLVSITAAADYLGVSRRTIYAMLADSRLKAFTLGPRTLRIRLADINAALQPYAGPSGGAV